MTRSPLFHFIVAMLLLIAVVTLDMFWYDAVTAESTKVGELASEIVSKTNDSAREAQAKSELNALSTDQAAVQQYFVSTNDVVPFLTQLQSTGSYLGSNVQVVSVSATPGTPYGKLSLSLSVTGAFNAVMRTLGSIEYGPYDTAINTLSFDAPQGPGATSSSSPEWIANALFSVGTENAQTATTTS
ncbi:MAG: hypothetical protein P4M11_02815 [Candidatus Pacebacteria bacterium]|nr:hypothetical protein [Candidatus Paceibacterota bacterium]